MSSALEITRDIIVALGVDGLTNNGDTNTANFIEFIEAVYNKIKELEKKA